MHSRLANLIDERRVWLRLFEELDIERATPTLEAIIVEVIAHHHAYLLVVKISAVGRKREHWQLSRAWMDDIGMRHRQGSQCEVRNQPGTNHRCLRYQHRARFILGVACRRFGGSRAIEGDIQTCVGRKKDVRKCNRDRE